MGEFTRSVGGWTIRACRITTRAPFVCNSVGIRLTRDQDGQIIGLLGYERGEGQETADAFRALAEWIEEDEKR